VTCVEKLSTIAIMGASTIIIDKTVSTSLFKTHSYLPTGKTLYKVSDNKFFRCLITQKKNKASKHSFTYEMGMVVHDGR